MVETFPNKKYSVIYADCPWRYDFSKSANRKVENQYPTMALEEIKSLQVPTEENAVLFLWATAPKLLEALEVIKAWGFEYKTQAIWDKEIMGMGYWFRGRHEILTVSTKGKFPPPKKEFRYPSIYREKRSKHSKKPDFFRDFIREAYTDFEKIELFARGTYPGWDVWGNEAG